PSNLFIGSCSRVGSVRSRGIRDLTEISPRFHRLAEIVLNRGYYADREIARDSAPNLKEPHSLTRGEFSILIIELSHVFDPGLDDRSTALAGFHIGGENIAKSGVLVTWDNHGEFGASGGEKPTFVGTSFIEFRIDFLNQLVEVFMPETSSS